MRRTIFAVALLLISAVPAFAVTRTVMVVDDVIKMTQAGVGDEEIIAFVNKQAASTPFEVNGDDVIAMQNAKVSSNVMKAVIDTSVATMRAYRGSGAAADRQRSGTTYDTADPADTTQHVVVSAYAYPYYAPYYYPYYSSPYWWYPGVSIGFGFGYYGYPFYGYRGGYFGHFGHGGGGHRGGGHGGGGHRGHH